MARRATTGRTYAKYSSNQEGDAKMRTSTLRSIMNGGETKTQHVPQIVEFMNIADYSQATTSAVDIDEPLFQPSPPEVNFEDYQPFQTYKKLLYMRNNDNVARRIKVVPPDSPFFRVSPPKPAKKGQKLDKGGKVAAGMEVCFTVTFKPQSRQAYSYNMVCVTEREKFIVPINAVGTRPCLDFPDQYDFGTSPVKFTQTKTIMVRNVGQLSGKFSLRTNSPFKVSCDKTFADVGEAVQITLEFLPTQAREYEEELTIEYDDSDRFVYMKLLGTATNVDVGLNKNVVDLSSQYISLQAHNTIRLQNRSSVPVKFAWKSFGTMQEERVERTRLHEELGNMQATEAQAIDAQAYAEDSDGELSDDEGLPMAKRREISALSRKYKNLRKAVEEDPLHFANDNFTVEPIAGEIWANSEVEVTVTFMPHNAALYETIGYVDVHGRESRLPVRLRGEGIGPKAGFSFDVLDIGDVFINSEHKYQLELINRGDIPCKYALQSHPMPFGPKFAFTPDSGVLEVGQPLARRHVLLRDPG
jgi:hydrocephalus-inducing protein